MYLSLSLSLNTPYIQTLNLFPVFYSLKRLLFQMKLQTPFSPFAYIRVLHISP